MQSAVPTDNVFVGDLPAQITKEQFERIMSAYGGVTACRVNGPKVPGAKASGLVRFATVEEASWVIENLNGNLAEGLEEPIVCFHANSPAPGQKGGGGGKGKDSWGGGLGAGGGAASNVWVGDLPGQITKEEFDAIMSAYGSVVSTRVMAPKMPNGQASALVRFATMEEATWVVENLNGNLAEGLQDPIVVKFAMSQAGSKGFGKGKDGDNGASSSEGAWGAQESAWGGAQRSAPYTVPFGQQKGGKGAADAWGGAWGSAGGALAAAAAGTANAGTGGFQAMFAAIKKAGIMGNQRVPEECQIFVKNLPSDTTDIDLYRLFAPFGAMAPSGVKAMPNEDGTCKGIGFVDFGDAASAVEAVNALHGFTMPDGTCLGVSQKKASGGKGGKGW